MRTFSLLFAFSIAASAQLTSSVQTFGMVGIAAGQIARISVLNVSAQPGQPQCIALVAFLDDQYTALKVRTFSVEPGRAVSLDLASDADLGLINNNRRQIRAVVAGFSSPTSPDAPPVCVLAPTVEIFDQSNGRTSLLITNAITIPQLPEAAAQSLLRSPK